MASPQSSPFLLAWRLSFPVLFAYGPLGIVFGLMCAHLQEPWYFAPLMSLVVYAGAVQFVAIGLMTVDASYLTIFLSTIFIALRNAFYGISLLKRFNVKWLAKLYLIHGLVDATYAILLATPPYQEPKQDRQFCLMLTALLASYWVGGTVIGSLFAEELAGLQGLEFVLIAFFVVLVLEQYLKSRRWASIAIASVAFVIAYVFFSNNMLLPAILICCGVLGANFYWESRRARQEK